MKEFLRRVAGHKERFTPNLNVFKETLNLGPKMNILVVGDSSVGVTSVLLDLAREFLLQDYTVFYFDCSDAVSTKRISDFNDGLFVVLKPDGSDGILNVLRDLRTQNVSQFEKILIVFDAAYLMSEDGYIRFKSNLSYLRDLTQTIFPKATTIVSERRSKPLDPYLWSAILRLEYSKGFFEDRTQYAHTVDVHGPKGSYIGLVDYRYGRLNRAFDYGYQLKLEGVSSSSNFVYNGEIYKGLWNLAKEAEWFK